MLSRWVVVVVLVLIAASCGGEDDGGDVAATTSTTSSSTTTTASATTSTSGGPMTTMVGETSEEVPFASPSGNIMCLVQAEYGVRCDIAEASWDPPPRPSDCQFDWGRYLGLAEDAYFMCISDTPFGMDPDPLSYGSSVERGPFTCGSERTGVTCRNTETGAGFMLSRDSYELFGEEG